MRALRIDGPLEVEVVDAPRPVAAAGERLIRVAFAGICATDRKLARRGSQPPRIPGHEFSGWLEDGTAVGVHPDTGCHACSRCQQGFHNRCARHVSVGLDREGGMAEWTTVPEAHILPIGDLDLEVAALLEPLACCLHATSLLEFPVGAPTLVVGAGPMGILAMWALQADGARVAVCETSAPRREVASGLGAHVVLDPDGDPGGLLGGAPLAAIVTAPGAEPLRWALERMEPGGMVHAFAGSPGGAAVDANVIHYGHLALVGSTGSSMRDYRRAYSLVSEGKVPLARMPRTLVSLEEAAASLREPAGMPDTRSVIDLGRTPT